MPPSPANHEKALKDFIITRMNYGLDVSGVKFMKLWLGRPLNILP